MTKLVWDNAACISPKTAKALGVASGDMVNLSRGNVTVEIGVWVQPGVADDCVQLSLGWGRTSVGRYGNGRGFDVSPLRSFASMGFVDGAKMTPSGKTYDLVQTQDHFSMEGRPIALDATLDQYRDNPEFVKYRSPTPKTLPLWDRVQYTGHKWGMAFDMNACTGCNACVVACTSENNVAFVGKDQVYRGREMHWLRIDRYYSDDNTYGDNTVEGSDGQQDLPANPPVMFQPIACVHCEEAPCENVCPVNATAHSPEGLNDMAYNRCIGTRYCGNNCPYKVRRFNFLNWRGEMYGDMPETEKMQFNPNVTVRMRGVMEKCSYCVQRIEEGKIGARRDGRTLGGNDIVSACQQACPSEAIVFGDLNDPNSKVAQWHKTDRAYAVLADIGTHPRTMHLGKVRNPNKEMV
jgi:molybdopterin-containing oxidoreductase family iron-sulfur binding subunit